MDLDTSASANLVIELEKDSTINGTDADGKAQSNILDTCTTGVYEHYGDKKDGIVTAFKDFIKKDTKTKNDMVQPEMCNMEESNKCNLSNAGTKSSRAIKQISECDVTGNAKNVVDDDQYDFSHPERGYAVIIVNEDFDNEPESKRDGAKEDLKKMTDIAKRLGFTIFNEGKELNLNKKDMLGVLRQVQQVDHSDFDCFALMISTHGMEMRNTRARGKPDHALECTDHQVVFTSSILEMFNDDNCPSLRDKPKLFIIQACRGENVDSGCEMNVSHSGRASQNSEEQTSSPEIHNETDPGNNTSGVKNPRVISEEQTDIQTGTDTSQAKEQTDSKKPKFIHKFLRLFKKEDTYSLRCHNDQLVMHAAPESMYAWRSEKQGSWMVHYLHAVLESLDLTRPRSLLSLLTTVAALMALRETRTDDSDTDRKKAIPVIEHRLTRDIMVRQT